jgi:gluconokinase
MSVSLSRYIVAADIGTTSAKALLVRTDGKVVASHSIEYPLFTPAPDRAEQDPEQIFDAVVRSIRGAVQSAGVRPADIAAVSFSSAMHSLILADQDGRPLTRCITWADNRGAGCAARLNADGTGRRIYLRTGTPIHPMSPLIKLMWFKENEPQLLERARRCIGIKEYVLHKLFGEYVVDYSIASATGLFDLNSLSWHPEALHLAGVSAEQLSQPVPTTHRMRGLRADAAAALGLNADTPFIVGASDGVLANLGAGASKPGIIAVTIGTSGAVRGMADRPLTDREGRLFCYALTGSDWIVGGAINNGGIVFRWVRDQLATLEAAHARSQGLDPYDALAAIAEEVPAGAEGLLFLPYLAGERAPYWNANARGVFFGLSLAHEKRHMIRAAMEGVMFAIESVADALGELSGPAAEIRASGGFARSPMWRQMLADVLGVPVAVAESVEASGLGAAQLALYALGEASGWSDFAAWSKVSVRHEPDAERHAVYRQLIPVYRTVYSRLTESFETIASFQTNKRTGGNGR